MDDIEAAHRGKYEEWKIMRACAFYAAARPENLTIQDLFPLPYDEEAEVRVDGTEDWITDFYNNATLGNGG